ncbi:hypothetical protein MA16_Dca022159 [Dendrobium catenatum]|uniref:Uncharacterized protein n=1 Tax=Dendrobium catenatum TaxID=906689 RepID=A0A2I0VJT9_9ASPA|nr:hypothetical protein MA16_Dca022159 [Dendrobium catenatum]
MILLLHGKPAKQLPFHFVADGFGGMFLSLNEGCVGFMPESITPMIRPCPIIEDPHALYVVNPRYLLKNISVLIKCHPTWIVLKIY